MDSSGNPAVFWFGVCIVFSDGTDMSVSQSMFVTWKTAWKHPASAQRASRGSPNKDLGSQIFLVLSDSKSGAWEENWKH